MRPQYIPESQLTAEQIKAGISAGILKPWRHDAEQQWYEVEAKAIRGVPPGAMDAAADDEHDIEADDRALMRDADELEIYRATIKVQRARAFRRYKNLVAIRADGMDIDPEFGNEILADAGRTTDDFDRDVAEYAALLDEL